MVTNKCESVHLIRTTRYEIVMAVEDCSIPAAPVEPDETIIYKKRTDSPWSDKQLRYYPGKRAACPRLSERISRLCRSGWGTITVDVEVEHVSM